MTKNELVEKASAIAVSKGLPVGLVLAICDKESSWDPDSVKYEPGFVQAYLAGKHWPVFAPHVSQDTEIWQRGASWGLMQVMGQVAREMGFKGVYMSQFTSIPEMGINFGCEYLLSRIHRFQTFGWPGIVSSYNAGSPASHNKDYVIGIENRIPGGFASLGDPGGVS